MQITPFRPEHAPGFRDLVVSTLAEFGFHEDPEIDGDLVDPQAHYDAVWVALDADETVVASVAMRRLDAETVELKRMYVCPTARGRGLGRRLLDTALTWAHEQHARQVVLDTTEEMQAARHLYEQAGFRRTGTRTERGAVDARCEVLYALDLSQPRLDSP